MNDAWCTSVPMPVERRWRLTLSHMLRRTWNRLSELSMILGALGLYCSMWRCNPQRIWLIVLGVLACSKALRRNVLARSLIHLHQYSLTNLLGTASDTCHNFDQPNYTLRDKKEKDFLHIIKNLFLFATFISSYFQPLKYWQDATEYKLILHPAQISIK